MRFVCSDLVLVSAFVLILMNYSYCKYLGFLDCGEDELKLISVGTESSQVEIRVLQTEIITKSQTVHFSGHYK